jgi:hypothetical protein
MESNVMNNHDHIDELFGCIKEALLPCWNSTGFGQITIESERIEGGKIRVMIKGSTHYRFVITEEEIQKHLRTRSG